MSAAGSLVEIDPREAVMLGATSLILYGKLFFPRTFRQESPPFHQQVADALYSPSRYNAFELFRGAAKTSLLRVYTSQRIAYAISRTIMFVSVSQGHSIFSVRWIKRQVEHNTRWAQQFQLEKGGKWTDEWIEVYHGVEKTPITLLAMGITGQIRGFNPDDYRPDLIILDDVLNEENTATEEQRGKIEALIFGALKNSLAPESEAPLAKMVFLQTAMHAKDSMAKCLQDPQWNGLKISVFDADGRSQWESRLPTAGLREEKEASIRRGQYHLWMREMECEIVHSITKPIDVSHIRHYDVLPDALDVILSIDPASSDSAKADDNVVMVIGVKGNDVWVLDYKATKGTMPDETAKYFFDFILMYNPRIAAVESISYQRVLKWYLEQEMQKRRIFLPIDAVQDRRSKANRIMQAIPGLVAYGHLYIKPSMTELLDQMNDWEPDIKDIHDDLLDALAMAITASNPALRAGMDIEGEFTRVDESEYKRIAFGGCP